MNLIHKINYDSEGFYDETFFYNGQEITETQFRGLEEDLKSDEDYDFEEECNCAECCGCDCGEHIDLEDIIHNAVIDICNSGGCPYCVEDRIRLFMSDVLNYIEE